MQEIAAFAGYSETAFVLKPSADDHDVHVRYFTPTAEVPICGHATIATHFIRKLVSGISANKITAKTGVGNLAIEIEGNGDNSRIVMTQASPDFGAIFAHDQIEALANALGIPTGQFVSDLPIQIVSTGHSKVMVPIHDRNILDKLSPDWSALSEISRIVKCNGFFVFTWENKTNNFTTYGRMFAPTIGINEDPVTGNANGPAGAYLAHYGILKFSDTFSYLGHQGHAMGKPGTVEIRLRRNSNSGISVEICGHAVRSGLREYFI